MVSRWTSVCLPVSRLSVSRPSVRFLFPDDNWSKRQWIFTKLGKCIDIVEIWFEIANGQISSNFSRSYLPVTRPYFFPDHNLSKRQRMFTKLSMCIDIVEIGFGIANGQISSNFDGVFCPGYTHIFVFWTLT